MKASELITQLETLMAEHGDLDVAIPGGSFECAQDVYEIEMFKSCGSNEKDVFLIE